MLSNKLYFTTNVPVNTIISSVIDDMKNAGADQFLSVMTVPEVYAYAYRELDSITEWSVKELLINVNKAVA